MKTINSKILAGFAIVSCLCLGSCVLSGCNNNGKHDAESNAEEEINYGRRNDSTINRNTDSTMNETKDSTEVNPG